MSFRSLASCRKSRQLLTWAQENEWLPASDDPSSLVNVDEELLENHDELTRVKKDSLFKSMTVDMA